ncbi:MAG: 2-amino-4-hydroxy-6-hydroxymethyldihydropteridine diphosphokinase [Planctomycetota bacterium]
MMSKSPVRACIGLGSNMPSGDLDPAGCIERAIEALGTTPRTELIARSSLHRTAPVGVVDQPEFINACSVVETCLEPLELLGALLGIERAFGRDRVRERRWGPRPLDLDLLVYGECVVDEPGLTVPHPRMSEREFVLAPLAEIASDVRVPGTGATVRELLGLLSR